ncbi:hypothetical protein P7K49_002032 [Saguinus oedipus]|uniref:Uncharacterized protein n=1 Tax=Saguinus oedipus TaxID=9490 RepID=A0ABQ9WG67_SAGOE|nr:hypothetical protein P7K49_002032 [Saguinus oedipus]
MEDRNQAVCHDYDIHFYPTFRLSFTLLCGGSVCGTVRAYTALLTRRVCEKTPASCTALGREDAGSVRAGTLA